MARLQYFFNAEQKDVIVMFDADSSLDTLTVGADAECFEGDSEGGYFGSDKDAALAACKRNADNFHPLLIIVDYGSLTGVPEGYELIYTHDL